MNDQSPPAGLGHNRPPPVDPAMIEDLEPRVRDFADAAGEWLDRKSIDSDAEAEKLNDMLSGLRALGKEIEDKRKAAKEPHLEAGRTVDATFKRLLDPLAKSAERVKALLTDFARRKAEAERERQRKAAEEAQRQAAEIERQKAEAEKRNDMMGLAEAEAAEKAAAEEAKKAEHLAAESRRIGSATGSGRTAALRTVRKAKVTSYRQLFLHYEAKAEVQETLERLANAEIRAAKGAAITIPGVEIIEEETIA